MTSPEERGASILWADDAFGSSKEEERFRIRSYKRAVEQILQDKYNIVAEITTDSGETAVDRYLDQKFDLILLDLIFGKHPHIDKEATQKMVNPTAFEFFDRAQRLRIHPPVVILSDHIPGGGGEDEEEKARFKEELQQYDGAYLAAFPKNLNSLESVCEFVATVLNCPPTTLVAVSDVHAGFIANVSDNDQPEMESLFREALLEDFSYIKEHHSPDYLIATGDFAWKDQQAELPQAVRFVNQMRHALGVAGPKQFHFCPGNHDVSFTDEEEWKHYHRFVRGLKDVEPDIDQRFRSYRKEGAFERFLVKEDVLSVSVGIDPTIEFAALNSVDLIQKDQGGVGGPRTAGAVGDSQWQVMERLLGRNIPADGHLRIALLHHPIFSAPGGYALGDDKPISDQARTIFRLAEMGFQIVLHGHTHYSCVWEHNFTVVNELGRLGEPIPRKLTVIGIPTLAASPNESTPGRQYLVIRIGHYDRDRRCRELFLRSRIFHPATCRWSDAAETRAIEIPMAVKG